MPPDAGAETSRSTGFASLDQRFLGSAAWTGGSRALLLLLGLVVTATLARLLAPADYGLMGMAMVFIGLVNQARDLGIGQAVIQRPTVTPEIQSQAFTLSVLVAFGLFSICWLGAPLVALVYGEPRVAPVVRLLALTFPLTAFQVLPLALLRRQLRLRGEAISRTVATLVDSIATIALAWNGYGVWALAIGAIANGLIFAAGLAWFMPWRPRLRLYGGDGRSLLRFGGGVTLSSFLWYIYSNADLFLIGRVLGSGALGLYTMTWTLAKMPWSQVWIALNPMVLPLFSRSRDERGGMARPLILLNHRLALLTFPTLVGLMVVAGDVVPLFLGPRWSGIVGPLRWLCLFGLVRTATLLLSPALLAAGRVARDVLFNGVCVAVLPIAFLVASRWGVAAVAAVWALIYPLLAAMVLLPPALRASGTTPGRYLSAFARPAAATAIMAAAVLGIDRVSGLTGWLSLLQSISTGILAYGITIRLLEGPGLLRHLRGLISGARAGAGV
ncbi:MAG: lipopolysaccharide biosynthesis protein [Terriglobia bacterium]